MTAYAPGLSAKEVQALDAAKLYYAGLSQQEVARRLHVSRPTVSKLLAYARRRGFVRIEIHDPREQDPMLLDTLRERRLRGAQPRPGRGARRRRAPPPRPRAPGRRRGPFPLL